MGVEQDSKVAAPERAHGPETVPEVLATPGPDVEVGLRGHSGLAAAGDPNPSMTPKRMLALQRTAGNRAVQRIVGTPTVQRDQDKKKPDSIQVTGRSVEPTYAMTKSAEIAIKKGGHNVAAWTTPNWEFNGVYMANDLSVLKLSYELAFLVELPSDYDAAKVEMLKQHELGHVEIAKRKAKEAFEVSLKAKIAALDDARDLNVIKAMITKAMDEAKAAEKAASQAFDDAEYKVMSDRYRGIKAPLAELTRASPGIAAAAKVLKSVPGAMQRARGMAASGVTAGTAARVDAAAGALSAAEVARVQFNAEFSALVSSAQAAANDFITSGELAKGLEGIGEGPAFNQDEVPGAQKVVAACGKFSYSSSGASAGF
ncbi:MULTISPECIES: DUF922 domain-containing protein [unclassified Nocardioides]|uniref:DUF922 domain-containing protein n=1 Tax=unclassified Nocardioides TaxID=2615069 RepID=UPI0006FBD535|nr:MULTISPECIES: DUF922 domain-containing protein [unclassified Nocardioides]KRA37247.1 hypothetical protein ASD81_00430 [Nocardioides sp. Root614]KRA91208.1 hypothetical protein ASD84_00695 [Nocardioides sp. Root682]